MDGRRTWAYASEFNQKATFADGATPSSIGALTLKPPSRLQVPPRGAPQRKPLGMLIFIDYNVALKN
jgi:hypothetical protein